MSTTTGDGEVPGRDGAGTTRATADDRVDDATGGGRVAAVRRLAVNEDWVATVTGLVLLALLLTGVVSPDVVP